MSSAEKKIHWYHHLKDLVSSDGVKVKHHKRNRSDGKNLDTLLAEFLNGKLIKEGYLTMKKNYR